MGKFTNILHQFGSPARQARQAWEDYKVGRAMRRSEARKIIEQKAEKAGESKLTDLGHAIPCEKNVPIPQPTNHSLRKGWNCNRMAEFPWRFEQVVQEESNWRGTWVLEVKDMGAMNWGEGTTRVPKESGRGGVYVHKATKHLPFPPNAQQSDRTALSCGGQDDLMVLLGRT